VSVSNRLSGGMWWAGVLGCQPWPECCIQFCAAAVTWGTPTPSPVTADVSNTGTLKYAYCWSQHHLNRERRDLYGH